MRRIISLLLSLTVIAGCVGCSKNIEESDIKSVNFYYCSSTISYESESGVIVAEKRDTEGHNNDIKTLLNLYFKGPYGENNVSPFPSGLTVLETSISDNRIQITLNDAFSKLNGLDATLASVCLVKTVQELIHVDYVYLTYDSDTTGKRHNIVFGPDNYLLADNTVIDTETEE